MLGCKERTRDLEDAEITREEDMIFNYREWSQKQPLQYVPDSSGIFLHKGYMFKINQVETSRKKNGNQYPQTRFDVSVFWPSCKPVFSLLDHIRDEQLSKYVSYTFILRPSLAVPTSPAWRIAAERPTRPVSTIDIPYHLKQQILEDFNDFLQPRTRKKYAKDGRPYRRGYLFYGPPGCGKTSLGFALGGLHEIDIYCVSLNDPHVTEETLMALATDLPLRCILILEDIDSSGIFESKSRHASNSPISLSCLLNLMDGMTAPEGVAFIITTNNRKRLPKALIRPGRVDMEIEFELAAKQQIKDLFIRMYNPETDILSKRPRKLSDIFSPRDPDTADVQLVQPDKSNEASILSKRDFEVSINSGLRSLADRFTQDIPDHCLQPR
ncbi:uncharacterized protein PV06_09728 [Exophiala oligosperma]|uniref:AAA+ ATPase domain-containing protein n=1 Tax=Exophiala oligosperma TaxID=215243 RepID=A0A0D2BJZ9_9EURO|nr:uncharacterized protein PV06_09728 [Exophiala oligosperma]KIW37732.1 hypothetical protein PV06_09728 [Exophiala oligosperma]